MPGQALTYARDHQSQYLSELMDFLRLLSVSTVPEHAVDMQRTATWLAEHLRQAGFQQVEVVPTAGHPVVYAEWLGAPGRPTVLIYGHYDVQPPDPIELWISPPFEPAIRGDNLYARGAADDKGQVFIHIKALESYLRTTGGAPVNVKMMIEGEEEIGSEHLAEFVDAYANRLAADTVVISDSHILSPTQPSIAYGLRGLCFMEVEVIGPDHDLHSGLFGGAVRNPANALASMIAQLHDDQGRVMIPGFYDRVRPIDAEERQELARIPYGEAELRAETGVPRPWGEAGYSIVERIGARPTLDVNGLISGWTGPGAKTVLPSKAIAKISMRLVPDQHPEEIARLFAEHIQRLAPPEVHVAVRTHHGCDPAIVDRHFPAMQAAMAAYKAGFGAEPIFTREGGSIPVVALFQERLGLPSILMGFGLADDNLHSPNEKFYLPNFYRGIDTSIYFMDEMRKLK